MSGSEITIRGNHPVLIQALLISVHLQTDECDASISSEKAFFLSLKPVLNNNPFKPICLIFLLIYIIVSDPVLGCAVNSSDGDLTTTSQPRLNYSHLPMQRFLLLVDNSAVAVDSHALSKKTTTNVLKKKSFS